jgi:hypothetical protein
MLSLAFLARRLSTGGHGWFIADSALLAPA